MSSGGGRFERVRRLSGDLVRAMPIVPSAARHAVTLLGTSHTLKRIAGDTEALPSVGDYMGQIAEATSVLVGMNGRIAAIEDAMPAILGIQRDLGQLPDTTSRLDGSIDHLNDLLAQMLTSLEGLAVSVEELRVEVGPVSRLASRVPGRRKSASRRSEPERADAQATLTRPAGRDS